MAIRLKFRKERVITDEIFFLFKPLTDVLDWDTSNNKVKANKMLFFVFLLCDLTEENPLKDIPANKKEEEAKFRAYKDRGKSFSKDELSVLQPAIECYVKYNTTPEERILKAFDEKSEETREELENTKPETVVNEKDGMVTFASNSSIITKGLKELESIKNVKKNVISAVRREAMSQAIRGKVTLSPLSKGNIELPSFAERPV
jgi:hypothetical protein